MNKKFFLLCVILPLFGFVKAQTAVNVSDVPEKVSKYFASHASDAFNVSWMQSEDANDVYLIASYNNAQGDQKQMVFKNTGYYASKTQVPLQYCPKKIRAALDTLAPGYKLSGIFYETVSGNKGYCATVQKGKGKKAAVRDMLFTLKGEFLRESETGKIIRGF